MSRSLPLFGFLGFFLRFHCIGFRATHRRNEHLFNRMLKLKNGTDLFACNGADRRRRSMYTYCELVPAKESVEEGESSGATYETRSWCPPDLSLQRIGAELKRRAAADPTAAVWNEYLDEAVARLADQGVDFRRPPADTDKLYMSLGGDDLIEVSHPQAAAATNGSVALRRRPIARASVPSLRNGERSDIDKFSSSSLYISRSVHFSVRYV